jgi:ABC-type multidrug transport system fused ATPase/permease subunit
MQMTIDKDIKLDNIDSEDMGDTLLKLEKSFGIKFAHNSFKDAKTFGDICQIIESQILFIGKDDCTLQQAFYKIREAIRLTGNPYRKNIEPKTKLEDVFPLSNRRQHVKQFEQALGFSVNILSMKTWLAIAILFGFIFSLIAFIFNWQFAVIGLLFFILFTWVASKFSKELNVSTVGHLTEKIVREHYSLARRNNGTVNKTDIVKIIQDVFIANHLLDRKHLTKDATLGWT